MIDNCSYSGEEKLQEELSQGAPESKQTNILTDDPDFNFKS